MACGATLSLKRSLEFDPVHNPFQSSPKRKRYAVTASPGSVVHHHYGLQSSSYAVNATCLTSDDITAHVAAECKHLKRDHNEDLLDSSVFPVSPSPSAEGVAQSSMSATCLSAAGSPRLYSPDRIDTPLFTFRQVSRVCEKMLEEREGQLREKYERVLVTKIAEQYEAFLKFNQDQLQRKFSASTASYVS